MVDGGSLENCCTATYRGFESLRLRNPSITNHMKRLICILLTCTLAALSWGQTAEEIVARMDEVLSANTDTDHFAMTLVMKMPIVGTVSSRAYAWGDKIRMEIGEGSKKSISWMDATTKWEYDAGKNVIEIENRDPSSTSDAEENMKMFESVTDGYKVSIKKETPTEWHLRCKKTRDNTKKDDPKTMDLVVAKGTYMPVSLSARMSMVTVTLRDLSFDVTEEMATFDPAKYPNATIVDKR